MTEPYFTTAPDGIRWSINDGDDRFTDGSLGDQNSQLVAAFGTPEIDCGLWEHSELAFPQPTSEYKLVADAIVPTTTSVICSLRIED
ncbi:MAG: hypothetical protein R3324_09345 [Halobacteriales archaeon]|nr:hypothetical protein [Halobacteriales archaeon]